MYKINHANIKEWAANYEGELFDGILCDPPYELGFMGKSWDSSGIAFDADMWADILKLLKPGGHLLAFSGSRTYHRMAVAIEDAGFEIRDMIEWVYGSGFPKSLNIPKALDKSMGKQRERIKVPEAARGSVDYGKYNGEIDDNNPITEAATYWNGYGTALKPAHEPCVLARKPLEGTVANNVLKHGTGGLNIDGTRIQTKENLNGGTYSGELRQIEGSEWQNTDRKDGKGSGFRRGVGEFVQPTGRFPANLIHDGSDEVVAVFPNESSRFFYTAKASKSERNAGLEGFELRPGGSNAKGYTADVARGLDRNRPVANHHPTVKPLSLTKYLATLIKPPTGGRLLVPFSGSGSEMIGALQAGWEYVEGVELTKEYIPIAEARIKYWLEQKEIEQTKPEQVALV